ncbi:MAG: hypothetical protein QM756_24185 [Polyangiaceae bacterium]
MLSRCTATFACASLLACQASMSADAKMSQDLNTQERAALASDPVEKGETRDHDRPLSSDEAARAHESVTEQSKPEPEFALFGARHDFNVKDGSGAVSCQCVSALLGPPSSGKLEWRGEMPLTKPESQLVVALIPGSCADGGDGASYWGYRVEGNDVVVLLEAWKAGRPRTLGAIIPRPAAGGQVYLAPVSAKLPFGKPASGTGARCAAGNPGPQRTTPLDSSDTAR